MKKKKECIAISKQLKQNLSARTPQTEPNAQKGMTVSEPLDKPQKRQVPLPHKAIEKVEAILSLWTDRRTPSQICQEMKIAYTSLGQWQDRALEGMFQALEPRVQLGCGPSLSPRLQALLEKRVARERKNQLKSLNLKNRLKQIQSTPIPAPVN